MKYQWWWIQLFYRVIPVFNPSTGKSLGIVPDMGEEDTQAAIKGAYDTFQTWRFTTAKVKYTIELDMY